MKTMNKVIAAMMMAITFAMPAMAGNKNHNGKKAQRQEGQGRCSE